MCGGDLGFCPFYHVGKIGCRLKNKNENRVYTLKTNIITFHKINTDDEENIFLSDRFDKRPFILYIKRI